MLKKNILLAVYLFIPAVGFCVPAISSISGTAYVSETPSDAAANVLTITLTGGGTKSTPQPWIWANFESSTQPTSLGYKTSWTVSENIESTTSAGGYVFSGSKAIGSAAGWANDIFRVRITTTADAIGRGGYWFVSLKRKVTYSYVDLNFKWMRFWDTNGTSSSGSQYPNLYFGTQGATKTARILGSEINPDTARTTSIGGNYRHPAEAFGGWRTDQYLVKVNSSTGVFDGTLNTYQFITSSGSFFSSSSTWSGDSANAPGVYDEVSIQDDPSGGTADGNAYYDDIYVDFTPSRVFLSDASAFVAGVSTNVNVAMQIPITWSATQITVYSNTAGFSAGQTVYMYVCDSANSCNASGFPMTIASAAAAAGSPNQVNDYWKKQGRGSKLYEF